MIKQCIICHMNPAGNWAPYNRSPTPSDPWGRSKIHHKEGENTQITAIKWVIHNSLLTAAAALSHAVPRHWELCSLCSPPSYTRAGHHCGTQHPSRWLGPATRAAGINPLLAEPRTPLAGTVLRRGGTIGSAAQSWKQLIKLSGSGLCNADTKVRTRKPVNGLIRITEALFKLHFPY